MKKDKIQKAIERVAETNPSACANEIQHAVFALNLIKDSSIRLPHVLEVLRGAPKESEQKVSTGAMYQEQAQERYMLGYINALTPLGMNLMQIAEMFVLSHADQISKQTVYKYMCRLHERYTGPERKKQELEF